MKTQPTDLGRNRTGMDACANDTREAMQGAESLMTIMPGTARDLSTFRNSYLQQPDPIGTVPVPTSFKGIAQTVMQKLTGKKPEVLIDKLGERLAFERTGTRLYDALLMKCEVRRDEVTHLPIEQLRQYRDEEAKHFTLVRDVIKSLGGDPTAVTPCADLDGVAGMGLMQVINDPRTTVLQSLHAIHIAELADHDGWQLLIKLTSELGMDEMATQFRRALDQEEQHLQTVREIMATATMTQAGAA
jgi:rubrerythrin